MIFLLQVTLFTLLTVGFVATVLVLWLGLSPELPLLEFLSGWHVFGSLTSTLAIYVGLMAYVFGWNPRNRFLQWFRTRLLLPLTSKLSPLIVMVVLLLVVVAAETTFLLKFDSPHRNSVVDAVWAENYAAADRELASLDATSEEISELYFVNDAIRQEFFSTSQSANKELCRIYSSYFSRRNLLFSDAWTRYMLTYAHASCRQVLEDPQTAIELYRHSMKVARWLGPEEQGRTARKIATIYFYSNNVTTGFNTNEERYRRIIALVGADSNETAQRMLGASYYLIGEYAKAADIWTQLLRSVPAEKKTERKKILNNIALAYAAQHQLKLSLRTVDEGIAISYMKTNERQRREQVRLLSTRTLVQLKQGDCAQAGTTWEERNSIRRQQLSKCTALLSAEVAACTGSENAASETVRHLLHGIGQDPDSFVDFTSDALNSVIGQSQIIFEKCYLGLTLDTEGIRRVLSSMYQSNQPMQPTR